MRDRATISDRPALASQAERVRRISLYDVSMVVFVFNVQMVIERNSDIRRSSRQSRMDKKCRRLINIPRIPR